MLRSCAKDRQRNYREVRRYATPSEISSYFSENQELLYWMALVITGTQELAESSIEVASKDSAYRRSVFLSWVGLWAQYAVARSAIAAIKKEITSAAARYQSQRSEHGEYPGLSEADTRLLRSIEPNVVFTALDPLARSVLVLHTLRNTTMYDCVAALDVSRTAAAAAYDRALSWLHSRQSSGADPANSSQQIAGRRVSP
jgi:hypothetical protein